MNYKRVLFLGTFLVVLITAIKAQTSPEYKILFEKAKFTMETKGDLDGAINLFNDIIKKYPKEREYAAKSQLLIGQCYEKIGVAEARKAYERVLRDYADQAEPSKLARERLSALKAVGDKNKGSTEVTMHRIWVSVENQIVGMSNDGRYVIFILSESGDLWLRNIQTGEQRQITHEASKAELTFASGPAAISPNGKQIVYGWQNKSNGELRLSAIDGSSMQVLHNGQNGRRLFAGNWIPNSQSILVVSYDMKGLSYQLQIISLSDTSIRNVGQPDRKYIMWVCLSPDGRQIAYSRDNDIYVYDVATEKESVFIQNPAIDALAGWIPDGTGIVFVSNRSGTHDLYLLGIENGKPRGDLQLLRQDFGANAGGFLTHDGRLLRTEVTLTYDSYIVPVDEQTGKLTGMPSQIDPNFSAIANPMWSPDGNLLYYYRTKGLRSWEEGVLVVRSETTGEIREIPHKTKLNAYNLPAMSPDGKQLAITSRTSGYTPGNIYITDVETGDTSLLVKLSKGNTSSGSLVNPCQNWSPDGKAIFYMVRSPEKSEEFVIRRKDLATGEEKDIHHGLLTQGMKISPDGTRFVYYRNDSPTKSYVLGILDVNSDKETVLWQVPQAEAPGGITQPQWGPNGKYVLAIRNLSQGSELWRFPSTGGPGEKLYTSTMKSVGFTIHPSCKRMAFTQFHWNYELWALENFLPKEKMEENNQLSLRKLDYDELNTPFARISSDGRYISYPDWNTGDLAIHNVATGENRQLTNKGSWTVSNDNAGYSLFSPDSKQVAYTWRIWSKNQTELRIVNIDGSQQRIIYKGDEPWPVSWSSNGKFILVKLMNKDKTWRPAIITVADSSVQDLAFQISGAMCFSPDGKFIAYDTPQITDVRQRDVYLYEIATKRTFPMIKHPSDDCLLGWAPDGKHLLFTSDRSGTRDAWLTAVSGGKIQGEPVLVRKNLGEIEGIGFTKSGDFYFHESVGGHNIFTAKLDFDSGKLISQPVETAGSYLGSNWRPDFSCDGKFLAYISNRGSGEDQGNTIVIRSLETGKERLLMPALELGFALRWATDGNSIFVNGTDKTKKEGLFRVDVQTGEARLIVEHHFVGAPGLEISPDGNMIFYTAVAGSGIPDGEAAYNVKHYVFDLKTGQEKELAQPGNTPLVPIALSPDGKQLAFIGAGDKAGSAGICIMPVSGGPSKQLVNIGGTGWASRVIAWTPDGRNLIYAVMLPETQNTDLGKTRWQLWRVSSEGGGPQRLDLKIDGLLRHLCIHPDGQQIVYYTWRGDTEAWVMQNILPK